MYFYAQLQGPKKSFLGVVCQNVLQIVKITTTKHDNLSLMLLSQRIYNYVCKCSGNHIHPSCENLQPFCSISLLWWHTSAITCQIIMLTCQIFMSSCQIFMLTCQLFMLTFQIIMSTCQKIMSTFQIMMSTFEIMMSICQIVMLTCRIFMLTCQILCQHVR